MYFQTTTLTPLEFWQAMESATKQEQRILALFRRWGPLSPSQCLQKYQAAGFAPPPITSIRRAITVLTREGHLVKTGQQVKGLFHLPEKVWAPVEQRAVAA